MIRKIIGGIVVGVFAAAVIRKFADTESCDVTNKIKGWLKNEDAFDDFDEPEEAL